MKRFPSLAFSLFLAASVAAARTVRVQRVIDGDTLKLSNGERVRLIGIDTPEVHKSKKLYRDAERTHQDINTIQELGRKAAAVTRDLAEGRDVELRYDEAARVHHHRDRYGRTLAYVYIKSTPPAPPSIAPEVAQSTIY